MYLLVVFLLLGGLSQCLSQHEGDTCTNSVGEHGICKPLTKCKYAVEEIKSERYPQVCGFQGTTVIVCCLNISSYPVVEKTTISYEKRPGEISKAKCKEYSKYAFEHFPAVNSLIPLQEPISIVHECPFDPQPLILLRPSVKLYPHMAQIGFKSDTEDISWQCSGSIISENFILTAAHCLNSRAYGPPQLVRVGMFDEEEDNNRSQTIKIVEFISHPEFTMRSKYHDIGLLKLEQNIDFKPYARPACLSTEKTATSERAILVTWSRDNFYNDNKNTLLESSLRPVDKNKCNNIFGTAINRTNSYLKNGIVEDYMLCYQHPNGVKGCSDGTSGGSLVNIVRELPDTRCMHRIEGVSSFGAPCGSYFGSVVFTRVSAYIKWIENTVWK